MMPSGLRKHMRYPELLLKLQAEVYGLYHMTDTEAFYSPYASRSCSASTTRRNSGIGLRSACR
jgi:uncharacterized membrane protein (UPF0182 family)